MQRIRQHVYLTKSLSGRDLLHFGKHRNRCYSEVFQKFPQYCEWALTEGTTAEEASPELKRFARWLGAASQEDKLCWKEVAGDEGNAGGKGTALRRSGSRRRTRSPGKEEEDLDHSGPEHSPTMVKAMASIMQKMQEMQDEIKLLRGKGGGKASDTESGWEDAANPTKASASSTTP